MPLLGGERKKRRTHHRPTRRAGIRGLILFYIQGGEKKRKREANILHSEERE